MSGAPPTPTLAEVPHGSSDSSGSSDALALAVSSARWAAGYALVYGLTRKHRTAEDLLDMCHSLVSTRAALGAICAARLQPGSALEDGLLTLPDAVDQESRTFLRTSTAYFAADFVWVLAQLATGRRPHLWAGRLAHHVIQLGANFPALASSAQRHVRTYLLIAYAAELSNILLRLRGLLKAGGHESGPLPRAVLRALLASFALTRIVNFPVCTWLIWCRRHHLPPSVLYGHLGFAAAGIALNYGWFAQLSGIARRELRR
jgi:hypothetical protein